MKKIKEETTVTASFKLGFKKGDGVKITRPENRRIVMLWNFITFRKGKSRVESFKVESVTNNTFTFE